MAPVETAEVHLPVVGAFATYGIGTDSYPVEIIGLERNGRTVVTRSAEVIASGALPGDDEFMGVARGTYVVLPKETGEVRRFTRRADGSFLSQGKNCGYLSFGKARYYRDPNV